jgi:hypothetical protein
MVVWAMHARTDPPQLERRLALGRGNLATPPGLDRREGKTTNQCVNPFQTVLLPELVLHYIWLATIAMLWVGCTTKEQSSEPPIQGAAHTEKTAASDPPQETAPVQAPVEPPLPSVPTQVSAAEGADASAPLTVALRRWIVAHKRLPRDFGEFSAGMEIPPPPPGRNYSTDKNIRVVLVAN